MTSVVLAGATGLIGSRVLPHLLLRSDVERVVSVGRRSVAVGDARLHSVVANLQDSADITSRLPDGVTVAICCLGTTMRKAGSKEAFRAVDLDAVVAFGQAARVRGAGRFVLVSSLGADRPRGNFYLETKAAAEGALVRLGFERLTIVRPSFIDDEGARQEFRWSERLALPLARLVFGLAGRTSRYAPIRADVLARAIVRLAFDSTGERVRIIESDELHALGR
jgi:uncharacterized protein YbjT (DUF2867 family)